jgi:hypothetical protein
MVDKRFLVMLKLSTVCQKSRLNFQEIIYVIQNWILSNGTPNGSPAQSEMRFSISLSVSLCTEFDNPIYQSKLDGLDRETEKI